MTTVLFLLVVVSATGILAAEPDMIWLSPKNVSTSASFRILEDFSAAINVWASPPTGVGSRDRKPIFHMDSKGTMWIYGGLGYGPLNAIWNYNPFTDQYRWVAGNNTVESQYEYTGQMGVPDDEAFPGVSDYSASAIDQNDNIWVYGGSRNNFNRLWMFNTTSLQFTWIGGDESNLTPVHGSLGSASADYWPGKNEGACMAVDSKNNLWMLGGYYEGMVRSGVWHYNTTSRRWSLQSGDPTSTNQFPDFENNYWPGRWTPACTMDENDRVWLFGGYAETPLKIWNDMWSFDTKTVTWRVERGFNESFLAGRVVSFDTFATDNYPAGRNGASMVDRRDGTIMMFGGIGDNDSFGDIWVFNKASRLWKIVFGNNTDSSHIYGEYRKAGSKLGFRRIYGAEQGLTSNGHLVIFGGVNGEMTFNDIWIVPQDLCTTNIHDCDPNASCSMATIWTWECTCNEGYYGDGKTCTQVPSAFQPTSRPTQTTSSASSIALMAIWTVSIFSLIW